MFGRTNGSHGELAVGCRWSLRYGGPAPPRHQHHGREDVLIGAQNAYLPYKCYIVAAAAAAATPMLGEDAWKELREAVAQKKEYDLVAL